MTSPGSALAAQRRRIPHVCPVCGKTFTAIKTAVICSNRCHMRKRYAEQKAKKVENKG